jgi:hypothetical protein
MVQNKLRRLSEGNFDIKLKNVPSIVYNKEVLSPDTHFHPFLNSLQRGDPSKYYVQQSLRRKNL